MRWIVSAARRLWNTENEIVVVLGMNLYVAAVGIALFYSIEWFYTTALPFFAP